MKSLLAFVALTLTSISLESHSSKPFRFPDGTDIYKSPNGVLQMPLPNLSGSEKLVVEGFNSMDTTNDVVVIDRNDWMLAVVYTKIRPEYPKDFTLIEEKILPLQRKLAMQYGVSIYQVSESTWGKTKVAESISFMPPFDVELATKYVRDLPFGYRGTNEAHTRRADVWFVRNGYFVQIICFANASSGLPPDKVMLKARELVKSVFMSMTVADQSAN